MTDATDQPDGPTTAAGRAARSVRRNATEVAEQAIGMGLFIGLLAAAALGLIIRQANLVTFPIDNGLLTAIAVVALVVGSAMDTSVVPRRD